MDHLVLPTEEQCSFCQYLRGERPFSFVWRSELVAVMVTREQRGFGHSLVVPVSHKATLLNASAEERHALIDAVQRVALAIDRAYERPGIAVWQNNGTAAHQMIPHLHFHVAGTLEGGGTEFGTVPELTLQEVDQIATTLRMSAPWGA